ncbi:MAG: Rap1a/Tai family immunity protein [Alphaproteobacteria bacterium]
MRRRLLRGLACSAIAAILSLPLAAEENFDLGAWRDIESRAAQNDPRASGLRDGYLAGVRDALRFYSKVSETFPICWPKDHEIDIGLIRNIIGAVQREHPDLANADDNFAYLVVLSLYDAYPCR